MSGLGVLIALLAPLTLRAGPAVDTATSPIGTNLGKLASGEMLWTIDQGRRGEGWLTQCDESCDYIWNTEEQDQLVLDADGWVVSFGSNPNRRFTAVALLFFNGSAETVPAGEWTVLYEGEATVEYSFAPFVTVVSRSPGRDVIRLDPTQASLLRIRLTDINPANHFRNLRLIPPGGICGDDPFGYAANGAGCPGGDFRPFTAVADTYRFHPLLLQALRGYRVLRFMQWQATIEDLTPESWEERSQLADAIWGGGWDRSSPQELIFELANQLQADPWVNLPFWADDAYVRAFAEFARGQLAPNLTIYLEYSNEVWNGAYPYSLYGNQIEAWAQARWPDGREEDGSPASGYTKRMNWVGMRTAQMCAIWKEAWGAEAGRVRCVMPGGPWGFPASEALACPLYAAENGGSDCAGQIDAVAAAPYFGNYIADFPNAEGGSFEQLLGWTQEADGGLDSLFTELRTGSLLQLPGYEQGAVAAAVGVMRANKEVADAYGLPLIAYEGGQHLAMLSGLGTSCNDWNTNPACPPYRAIQNLYLAANRDPRMGELYRDYLDAWRAEGGTLFVHYTAVGIPTGPFGAWGALEAVTQPHADAPKYQAILNFIAANPCWWEGCAGTTLPTPTVTRTPGSTPSPAPTGTPTATPTPTATVPTPSTATPTSTATPVITVVPPDRGGVIDAQLGRAAVRITIPAGAHAQALTVRVQAMATPPAAPGHTRLGDAFAVTATDAAGRPVTHFARPLTLAVTLAAEGWIEPPGGGWQLSFWDESAQVWVALPTTRQGPRTFVADVDHLTPFALLAPISDQIYLPAVRR